jgi:hypothetical protein
MHLVVPDVAHPLAVVSTARARTLTAPLDRVNRFQAMDLLVGTQPGPCSRDKPLVGQHRR